MRHGQHARNGSECLEKLWAIGNALILQVAYKVANSAALADSCERTTWSLANARNARTLECSSDLT